MAPKVANSFGRGAKKYTNSAMKSLKPQLRELRYSAHLFKESKLAMVGIILILFVVAIAIIAPLITEPNGMNNPIIVPKDYQTPKPPGAEGYIMGTGASGEDIYYGVIWGARTSIYTAISVVGIALLIGIVLGAIAGYYGGIIDELLMRITDIFLSIPALILAMAVAAVLTRSLDNILLSLIIVWWPGYARLVRGQVLSIKENTYVEAARAIGAKKSRILFRHIVPNSLAPITVSATMDLGTVVLTAAALSFIGFSQPGIAEWGRMISAGAPLMFGQYPYPWPDGPAYNPWWAWVFPGIFIIIFVMGFNLLGDGLRDIMDPRLRK